MHSILSNVEVYKNDQQIYIPNGLYAHKAHLSNNFKGAISEYKGLLHYKAYDCEGNPDDAMDNPLEDPFFSRRMKMSSKPSCCMVTGCRFFHRSRAIVPDHES